MRPAADLALEDATDCRARLERAGAAGPPPGQDPEDWRGFVLEAREAQEELELDEPGFRARLARGDEAAQYLEGKIARPPGLGQVLTLFVIASVTLLALGILAFLMYRKNVGLQTRRLDLIERGVLPPEYGAPAAPFGETLSGLGFVLTGVALIGAVFTLRDLFSSARADKREAA
jgi:hypothetical protein